MSTLSRPFPLSRLALLRRVPFWAQALAVCALFAITGVATLDDYGVSGHEVIDREIAIANVTYIATGDISELFQHKDIAYRYYGMAFNMLLLLSESAPGLQDSRDIYLTRHLIMHLFFIAGGFTCGLLAYRLLGDRWIALFAMLLFLLHPRLYAHSFFNPKDIPFAAMFVIALYLAHRAFRKDAIGAFMMCGIVVGLAINLRPFALLLLPMMLAMRALDLWHASREERKRILATAGIFAATALATLYITHPYYWENPLRFIEGMRELSYHPILADNLFMGKIYRSDSLPWNYIPVWFAITAPPLTLLLGAIGCGAVCWQAITRPLAALRDREIRFGVMTLGCFALPIVVVIALQANTYNGWRHMYFLWGPFCLLAAVGLHEITNISMKKGIWKVGSRLPGWVRGDGRFHMARRALAYGAVGAGLATTLTAMAALHPHEQVYFNALVDTNAPGALSNRYDMDYSPLSGLQALEYLLARYPDDTLRVWIGKNNTLLLPLSDRRRIIRVNGTDSDFYFNLQSYYRRNMRRDTPGPPTFHSIRPYGSAIATILAPNSDAYLDYYRAEYNDVEANGDLLFSGSAFDIYAHNGALRYLSANCAPLLADAASADSGVFLHIIPNDPADLPVDSRERGFENMDFWMAKIDAFFTHTGFFDGKCVTQRPLPDYPIARIRTGQNAVGGNQWRADINLAARAAAQAAYDGVAAGEYGQPLAQADFDVYLRGKTLAYLKENCKAGDADARFFLHIIPVDIADIPAASRELGFANLDFQFPDHGARIDNKCVATRELPAYPIDRIRTGQFISGEGRVWVAEFPAAQ